MILRKYQEIAVADAIKALNEYSNTVVVAPTGAGKTIMLSALIGKRFKKGKRILVLQHRDELVTQNSLKFNKVNPRITTSIVNGTVKHWDGSAVFSMVQTLSRDNNLNNCPKFDMIVIDESHHAVADTYLKIINAVKKSNPKVEVVGFTATPNRGDRKGLREVFNNCSHQIELSTLIREGFLVPPKAFVIDLGVTDDLRNVRKTSVDFDMAAVEAIMNKSVLNESVVNSWEEKAKDRKTVVFCSTIKHAEDLQKVFVARGYNAKMVTGDTDKSERATTLHDLEFGNVQVVLNVAVLTEGFDAQPVSCIVLTRPCSYKSTMVQMIGRGLRIVDPEIHPNIIKKDCIVLDFGTSIITHGNLDESVDLVGASSVGEGEAPNKVCPECEAINPINAKECFSCGHLFKPKEKEEFSVVELTEFDLLQRSPFRWIDLFGNGVCKMAMGFNGFGLVATLDDLSIGIVKKTSGIVRVVGVGGIVPVTSAADDFLREIEDGTAANKTKRWLNERATEKQREILKREGIHVSALDFSWDKYKAACWISYLWNKKRIDEIITTMGINK